MWGTNVLFVPPLRQDWKNRGIFSLKYIFSRRHCIPKGPSGCLAMYMLKDSCTALRSLGIYTPVTKRKQFKSQSTDLTTIRDFRMPLEGDLSLLDIAHWHHPQQTFVHQTLMTLKQSVWYFSWGQCLIFYIHLNPALWKYLSLFYNALAEIKSEKWVISTVKVDYVIQLTLLPFPNPSSPYLFRNLSYKTVLDQELQSLLELGAIEEAPYQHRGKVFFSCYFLILTKRDGFDPFWF